MSSTEYGPLESSNLKKLSVLIVPETLRTVKRVQIFTEVTLCLLHKGRVKKITIVLLRKSLPNC